MKPGNIPENIQDLEKLFPVGSKVHFINGLSRLPSPGTIHSYKDNECFIANKNHDVDNPDHGNFNSFYYSNKFNMELIETKEEKCLREVDEIIKELEKNNKRRKKKKLKRLGIQGENYQNIFKLKTVTGTVTNYPPKKKKP